MHAGTPVFTALLLPVSTHSLYGAISEKPGRTQAFHRVALKIENLVSPQRSGQNQDINIGTLLPDYLIYSSFPDFSQ